jgi:RNA polymerase sigma-70 factor (ECF subfamily)
MTSTMSCAGSIWDRAGAMPLESLVESKRVISPDQDQDQVDTALMQQIGRGDRTAYRRLVELYLARVTRFAARILGSSNEAEDVAQETFLRVWTEASRWTPRAKPKTWIYRVARNQCIDRLRKRRDVSDAVDQQSDGDRPSLLLVRKQTAHAVEQAMLRLPERQRAAITLLHYEGLSSAEACDVLEIGPEALESLLARGRRQLREELRELSETVDRADGGRS